MEITLSKPLKHGEELIEVISLREPTAKEIKKIGFPFDFANKDVNAEAVFKFIGELAALPPSVVDQLSAKDFMVCVGAVIGFFGDLQA